MTSLQNVDRDLQLYTAPEARLVIPVLLAASEAALDFDCERQLVEGERANQQCCGMESPDQAWSCSRFTAVTAKRHTGCVDTKLYALIYN